MQRVERTLSRPAQVTGIGFFTGADVRLQLLPADEGTGLRFQRVDLVGQPIIPALIEHVSPRPRRTAISYGGGSVEMVEHVLAALAGLQIDNCLIQLDAPEPPGGDGSSQHIVEAILAAGIAEQRRPRELYVVAGDCRAQLPGDSSFLTASPVPRHNLVISYQLDYGPLSVIPPQQFTIPITPELFVTTLAFARTFVLETEVAQLQAAGYGQRLTPKDVLIFGAQGPIGNALRTADECVRHKILDCVGDFALMGCDLHGNFRAYRSGHAQNHQIIREVRSQRQSMTKQDFQKSHPSFAA